MVTHIRNSALGLSGKVKKGSILEILIKGLTYLHDKYAGLNIMFGFEWLVEFSCDKGRNHLLGLNLNKHVRSLCTWFERGSSSALTIGFCHL